MNKGHLTQLTEEGRKDQDSFPKRREIPIRLDGEAVGWCKGKRTCNAERIAGAKPCGGEGAWCTGGIAKGSVFLGNLRGCGGR